MLFLTSMCWNTASLKDEYLSGSRWILQNNLIWHCKSVIPADLNIECNLVMAAPRGVSISWELSWDCEESGTDLWRRPEKTVGKMMVYGRVICRSNSTSVPISTGRGRTNAETILSNGRIAKAILQWRIVVGCGPFRSPRLLQDSWSCTVDCRVLYIYWEGKTSSRFYIYLCFFPLIWPDIITRCITINYFLVVEFLLWYFITCII